MKSHTNIYSSSVRISCSSKDNLRRFWAWGLKLQESILQGLDTCTLSPGKHHSSLIWLGTNQNSCFLLSLSKPPPHLGEMGPWQSGLVGGVLAHGGKLELHDLQGPLQHKPLNYFMFHSTIISLSVLIWQCLCVYSKRKEKRIPISSQS